MQMQIKDATVNTPIKQKANMHTRKKTKKEKEREEKVK